MTFRALLTVATALVTTAAAHGQTAIPTLYIEPGGGFEADLSAAMTKKKVPVRVVETADLATHRLNVTIDEAVTGPEGLRAVPHPEACCGATSPGSTPVEFVAGGSDERRVRLSARLVDAAGVVVWSYSVTKEGGATSRRSLAETVATRLKDDYLRKRGTR
jgi:hypothetical protein